MTNSRANLQKTLNHQEPDRMVVDFGASPVTGIHVLLVEKLREHFGLEKKAVRVNEPYQMLGEVEDDLQEAMGVDVIGVSPSSDMFGNPMKDWKEWRTPWGQVVLVPGSFTVSVDGNGDTLMYPQGDASAAPSAKMPKAAYFFDAMNRQEPLDESPNWIRRTIRRSLRPLAQDDLDYWKRVIPEAAAERQRGGSQFRWNRNRGYCPGTRIEPEGPKRDQGCGRLVYVHPDASRLPSLCI